MQNHLVRRGGIWSARLVVPVRLRDAAGRREFTKSCRTQEASIAKLVAAVFLADWRRQLLRLESVPMTIDVLRLVEGSPVLAGSGWVSLSEAVNLSGISQAHLLKAVADSGRKLFCRLSQVQGHIVAIDVLEPVDVMAGRSEGVVIPGASQMPASALASTQRGVLPVCDPDAIAAAVLADGLQSVEIVAFDIAGRPGMLFAPDTVVSVEVGKLEMLVTDVEAMRQQLAQEVRPERVEHARAERRAGLETQVLREKAALNAGTKGTASVSGKWANKRFSEAVDGYCKRPDGLPHDLSSEIDQRQRKAGLMLFAEFMGNLRLGEIDGDVLRKFRDGPLKTIPGRANTLPKEIKRASMKATIEALKADGREWPLLSTDMQHDRMQWLARLFAWLHSKGYLNADPSTTLRGETGMTKAERNAAKQTEEDDDEEGREPFTPEQLMLIFGQQHYKVGHGMHVKKPARWYGFEYWLPLLGLFAGLRIKEASQLHLSDVKEVDGVWCLDINRRSKDTSLKNDQSVRVIPLHPELMRLGFLRYCDRLRQSGYRRVFPELTWSKSNAKYAKESGRKMSAMLKKLGMPRDGTLVYHCLRHNMNNALARVPVALVPGADENLKKFIQYSLMGHVVGKDVNARHYTHTTAAEKAALAAGVTFALPAIHEFDIEFAIGQIELALNKKAGFRQGREDMGPLNDALYPA